MTNFILVTTTREPLNRDDRFARLHRSVIEAIDGAKPSTKVHIICVAQASSNEEAEELVRVFPSHSRLTVSVRASSQLLSLSDARNMALNYVRTVPGGSGERQVIAFPDDDCAYRTDTLREIEDHFERGVRAVVTRHGDAIDESSRSSLLKDRIAPLRQAIKAVSSNSMFLDYQLVAGGLEFDPNLGLGTKGGSAEDLDYFTRALDGNYEKIVLSRVSVIHPRKAGRQERYYRGNVLFYRRYSKLIPQLKISLARQFAVGLALVSLQRLKLRVFVSAWKPGVMV